MPDWGILRARDGHAGGSPRAMARPPHMIVRESTPRRKASSPGNFRSDKLLTPIDQLAIFREQCMDAHGDMFFKVSRFQRSRRHYAELRGATIVVYRSPTTISIETAGVEDVMTVLPVQEYKLDIIDMGDDGSARVYVTPSKFPDTMSMFIRVQGRGGVNEWRIALGRLASTPLPCLSALTIQSVIGRGGGGKVFVVKWGYDGKTYALKVIDKIHTFRSGKGFRHVASERVLMEKVGWHPFLLPMQFAFQSEANLFIGTPFCRGGDLASYMRQKGDRNIPNSDEVWTMHVQTGQRKTYGRLSEEQTRRIVAEIVLGLEHLHNRGIIYRDLKPENIFIGADGHILIGDYGLAKQLRDDEISTTTATTTASTTTIEQACTDAGGVATPTTKARMTMAAATPSCAMNGEQRLFKTMSICGTRNYLPPEMLNGRLYSFEADVWSLGVMLYRMLCGVFPFDGRRTKEVFHRIKKERLRMPAWISPAARDLLHGLLDKRPERRLTLPAVKRTAFFSDVDWDAVLRKRMGKCIPDIDASCSLQDALDNFELSKLQGITLGEYVSESQEAMLFSPRANPHDASSPRAVNHDSGRRHMKQTERPTHRKSPRSMMIGFEYIYIKQDETEVQPLGIRQKSSGFAGLMSKLSSVELEQQLPLSPRTPFTGAGK